jgi:hypothetical protein
MGRIILKYDCNTSCVRDTFEEFFQDKTIHYIELSRYLCLVVKFI